GNLGLTQKGRIEYAAVGGHLNIDAIDNSGGVDCSDHEVNLKILLGIAVKDEGLERAQRDEVLRDVEGEVAELVLYDNYLQAQIISQEVAESAERLEAYEDLMLSLEESGMIDRGLESLPSSEQMAERMRNDAPMFRPELCVLLSYAKFKLEDELRDSELLDDLLFQPSLLAYFPERVRREFGHLIDRHPLRGDLISTIVSNTVVNSQGITFASRLSIETGASLADVVRAYWIARTVTGAPERWSAIETLDGTLEPSVQNVLMVGVDSLVEEVTRWYLAHDLKRSAAEVGADVAPRFEELAAVIEQAGSDAWRERRHQLAEELVNLGVEDDLARRHVYQHALAHGPALLETALTAGRPLVQTAEAFFLAGERLRIDWLERRLATLDADDRYERLAVRALRDDLRSLRRDVAARTLAEAGTAAEGLTAFTEQRSLALERLERLIEREAEGNDPTLAELTVFVRQLRSAVS
ncbi:MAG: NAD-glutamate dehydrogenase domain-containing protein, partial [Gaiellaceae bacterium]